MERYTVPKNKHAFLLWGKLIPVPAIRKDVKNISWTVQFDQTCAYDLGMPDQRDWNKGGGLSFDMITNHEDAAMWGWRYNPAAKVIELTAYCHINGKRPILHKTMYSEKKGTDGEVCLECGFADTVRISMQVDRQESRYDFNFMVVDSGESWPVGVAFMHGKRWSRLIHAWFGGNRAAPHKMDIRVERK